MNKRNRIIHVLFILSILLTSQAFAQNKKAEDFGFKHLQTIFKGDSVDILIKSKKGDELKRKPILLFCQGSLPRPLIQMEGESIYSVFPFRTDSLEKDYHLAIIGKPSIPLMVKANTLAPDFVYQDPETGKMPKDYSERNLLDYYVERNLKVIDFLTKQPFVDNSRFVVAGHSEGSTIASKLAMQSKQITHLIYASGNPLGRIMSIIGQARANESDTDSTRFGENALDYWEQVVINKNDTDDTYGDTHKATYDFSIPSIRYLEKLSIPVLICYGTKDWSAPFNDYLRVEMLRQQKKNFTFNAYIGLEHNFFQLTESGRVNHDSFNWDKVADDWLMWLKKN